MRTHGASRGGTASRSGSNWIVTPEKFLAPAQVQKLRQYTATERERGVRERDGQAVRNAAILETLLGTGVRVSECCSLTIGDLFLDDGSGSVLVRRGKGGKTRLVAISDALVTYLRQFLGWKMEAGEPTLAASPLFLSERKGHLTRSAVHRVWKRALKAATLPTRWGVHATRHSYAVEIYRKTRDLRLTQRLLGHSSPVVTSVYANLLDDDVRRGVAMVWA